MVTKKKYNKDPNLTRAASQARVRMFIQMAHKYGVSELKVGDIELKLSPQFVVKGPIDKDTKSNDTDKDQMPTDEEFQYWNSPHYDELQALKKSK